MQFLQLRLDLLSLEEGRLVQTYEVFDLTGMGYHMMTMTVINFAKDILLNYSTHYPQSFRKAAVLNAPAWLPRIWRLISHVLPTSVKAKVRLLGRTPPLSRLGTLFLTLSPLPPTHHRSASSVTITTRS